MYYIFLDGYKGKDVQMNPPPCGDIYVLGSDVRGKILGSYGVIDSCGWLVVTVESESAWRVNETVER
jgi:hypothetical protein